MQAYHGTIDTLAAVIKASGLTGNPVYISLDIETAEQYAYIRAKQHGAKPLVVCLTLPDNWSITPDPNTDDDDMRDAWISSNIPASCITDCEVIAQW